MVVHLLRPWACAHVLANFSPEDDLPYANFDRHGVIGIIGGIGALVFAVPLFWLARNVIPIASIPMVARRPSRRLIFWSGLIAMAIAAPGIVQIAYMTALPAPVMWPVMLSAASWFVVVFILWWWWLQREDVAAEARRLRLRAVALGVMLFAPKLMFLRAI